MATRKQKHALGLAKRAAFEAKEAELGRKAIEAARHKRESEQRQRWESEHPKHHKFEDDCPLCTAIKNKQAVNKVTSSKGKPARKSIDTLMAESPAVENPTAVEKAEVSV